MKSSRTNEQFQSMILISSCKNNMIKALENDIFSWKIKIKKYKIFKEKNRFSYKKRKC